MELDGAHVDGDLDVRRPGGRVQAGLLQDPFTERQHQSSLLGDTKELHGRQHALRWMMPAHEAFQPGHRARSGVDHRLIVQLELVAGHRLPQFALHRLLCVGSHRHFRLEDSEIIPARGFRRVERDVRLL